MVLCGLPPLCVNGVPTVPLGGCCPVCDPATAAPESEQPTETEETKTTEALPSVNTEPVTEKPCENEGAAPVRCAPSCPATCLSPFVVCDSIVCDVPGMCACPDGQVIDEVNNRCVPRDECPTGIHFIKICCKFLTIQLLLAIASPEPETSEPEKKPKEEEEEEEEEESDDDKKKENSTPDPNPDPEPDNEKKTKFIAGELLWPCGCHVFSLHKLQQLLSLSIVVTAKRLSIKIKR